MVSIDMVAIGGLMDRWGISAGDYGVTADGRTEVLDFQDLMVKFSKNRAVVAEGEVEPLATRIRQRNDRLDELGAALAELTKIQSSFASDAKGSDACGNGVAFSETTARVLRDVGYGNDGGWTKLSDGRYIINKQTCDAVLSRVKSEIDGLNNEAQTDMTRLQSLVDRRDESYSTATNLMTSLADTRSNAIGNM